MRWPPGGDVVAPPPGSPAYRHPHPAPRLYPQILRTWAWRKDWWRSVVGILTLAIGVFLLAPIVLAPVLIASVAVEARLSGEPFGPTIEKAFTLDTVTPSSMLWLNLTLASGIVISFALVRWLHHLRPRWLTSVAPGIRWRFFWACLGLSVLALVAQLVVSPFLPLDDAGTSGTLNRFDGTQIALTVVILLTTPLQAMGEEYAFRGYLMQAFGSLFGSWAGVIITGLLFACAHGIQNAPLFLDRFAFGLMAGYLVVRTGGLEAGIALHILNNLVAFGFALTVGDLDSALNVSEVSWWNLPLTVIQNGLYLVLVLLVFRRMGLSNRTSPPDRDVGPGAAYGSPIAIGDGPG